MTGFVTSYWELIDCPLPQMVLVLRMGNFWCMATLLPCLNKALFLQAFVYNFEMLLIDSLFSYTMHTLGLSYNTKHPAGISL